MECRLASAASIVCHIIITTAYQWAQNCLYLLRLKSYTHWLLDENPEANRIKILSRIHTDLLQLISWLSTSKHSDCSNWKNCNESGCRLYLILVPVLVISLVNFSQVSLISIKKRTEQTITTTSFKIRNKIRIFDIVHGRLLGEQAKIGLALWSI